MNWKKARKNRGKKIKVGDNFVMSITIDQKAVGNYAQISKDFNRIHIDPNWAVETGAIANIIHGNLIVALMTGILGTEFPGSNTILASQTFKFKKHLYVDSEVTIVLTIIKLTERAGVAYINAKCISNEVICIEGEFKVFNPKIRKL